MRVNGQIVNIELQVKAEDDFGDRTLFYWAKIFTGELSAGDEYGDLRKTICINIINFNYFDCKEYHSHFQPMELHRHEVLSDKMDIHFFELRKLRKSTTKKPMEDWLNLINAETEGDLMDIQNATQSNEVKKAIVILREMNADAQIRQEAYYREKRLCDEASALSHAWREGEETGILITFADLVKDGILTLADAAQRANMSVTEFEAKIKAI